MTTMAQCTRFSPKNRIKVWAIWSAPPDSAIIFPSMVPRPITTAIWPSVPPTPASKECTMVCMGMPVTIASAMETDINAINGFAL